MQLDYLGHQSGVQRAKAGQIMPVRLPLQAQGRRGRRPPREEGAEEAEAEEQQAEAQEQAEGRTGYSRI